MMSIFLMKIKAIFLVIFLCMVTASVAQNRNSYRTVEEGYFTGLKATAQGIFFSDNYHSGLYKLDNGNQQLITSERGCGLYFSVSDDGSTIGYKHINEKGKQHAVIMDDSGKKTLKTNAKLIGQPCIGPDFIGYSDGSRFILNKNGNITEYELSNYINLVEISPDAHYAAYSQADTEEMMILDLTNGEKYQISPPGKSCHYPVWSDDAKKLVFNMGKDLVIYDVIDNSLENIGHGSNPEWIDSDKLVFQKTQIQDFQIRGSEIVVYSSEENTLHQLTYTPDHYETHPSYHDGYLYFTMFDDRRILKMPLDIHSNIVGQEETVFNHPEPLDIHYQEQIKTDHKSAVNFDNVPYVHQVYDTPSYHNGYGSCAPSTSVMAAAYYNRIPPWPVEVDHGYSWDPHINEYGSYVADKFRFNEYYFDDYSDSKVAWGGYAHMWVTYDSPSNNGMYSFHDLLNMDTGLEQIWTSSISFSYVTSDIDQGYVVPICSYLSSAGHLTLTRGYLDTQHTLIFNDPYGDKNTAGYPSYDGINAYYDWPGYNNGYQNLDPDGYGYVAWIVSSRTQETEYNDTIIDSNHYDHGFYMNNSENSSHQRYFWDANAGYNGHFWYTITMDATEHIAWVTWSPNLTENGYYEVMAYIPSVHATATTATYEITHADGTNSVNINQLNYSDEWVSLGQYRFDPAQDAQVFLGDNTGIDGQDIAYDAVKWSKVTDPVYISYGNITCHGDNNGTASVIINDPDSPHEILWNTGDTTQTLTELPPDTYSVTVTNAGGTSFFDAETIIEPDSLQINAELQNPVTAGTASGNIITNVSGGTNPYDYMWENSQTEPLLTDIQAGLYGLTVTDANGCSVTETFELTDPVCDGTTNLTATSNNWNSITVSWTNVDNVNAYYIQYKPDGASQWEETTTGSSPAVISGLQPETTYDIRVASICTDTMAEWQYCNATTPAISNTVSQQCYGIFTDTGGENNNYDDYEDYVFTISPDGAEKIVMNFYDIQIEADYDTLYIYDGPDTNSPLLTYFSGMIIDDNSELQGLRVASTDSALTFRFVSDYLTTEAGWYAKWTSYGGTCASSFSGTITDNLDNNWATADFNIYTSETDDNGDGISHAFSCIYNQNDNQTPSLLYQADEGFLYESPTNLNSAWIPVTGTWAFSDNAIFQSDESESNTNLYIPVDHSHGSGMLFEADIKVAGSGSNRRSGFHFACDAPTETGRGNSYLVYIRPDQDELHLNEYIDNVWHNRTIDAYDFEPDVFYNLKVYYNPQNGEITTWIDDELVSSWIDSSPITTGVAFSLRSGNAQSWYKNLRIYRETADGFTITAGADTTDQYHYQNPDSITPAGKIARCITNIKNHIYTYDHHYNVDYTPPSQPAFAECTSAINDTLYNTDIEVAWGLSEDQHSGIDHYVVSVGSETGIDDVMPWTEESAAAFNQTYNDLPFVEAETYYINVKSVNGAGLHSPVKNSVSYVYESPTKTRLYKTGNISIFPNPAENLCHIKSTNGIHNIQLYSIDGKIIKTLELSGESQYTLDLQSIKPGHYRLIIQTDHTRDTKSLIVMP